MAKFYMPMSRGRNDRYLVSVKQYAHYHRNGYLIVRGLLSKEDIAALYGLAEETRIKRLPLSPIRTL